MKSALLRRDARCFSTRVARLAPGPRFTPTVQALAPSVPFVAPEEVERVRRRPFVARLGANENTFGPSPRAIAAMQAASAEAWKYGDPTSHELRAALAAHHGVRPNNLVVGEGIDGLLSYIAHLLVAPGDAVVTTAGTYPTWSYSVAGCGGQTHTVPYGDDDRHDLRALLTKAEEVRPKIVYLVNPDNPSGTCHTAADVEEMLEQIPAGTILVLDEAYIELSPFEAPKLSADDQRVIRLRTFSKVYGMAGARIGYAIGAPSVIHEFDKIRNHFGIGRISQAGAIAAIQDHAYFEGVRAQIIAARDELSKIASAHGLTPLASGTNFVSIDCGRDAVFARQVLAELLDRDVFARMPGLPPLDRCIRVSVGRRDEIAAFGAALPEALDAAERKLEA